MARARRRADERERRQVERDHARARPLADRDRQTTVLHRRVERLLERARQAMDLIHEEHAARLERREEGGDVSLSLERGAGGLHERGLAEARWTGQQQVIECVAARPRRLDRDRELLAQRLLSDEVLQTPRAKRAIELVLGDQVGRLDPRRLGRDDALAAHEMVDSTVVCRVPELRIVEAAADAGRRPWWCRGRGRGRGQRPAKARRAIRRCRTVESTIYPALARRSAC